MTEIFKCHNAKPDPIFYKIDEIPSDTYIRERLDVIDPAYLRPAFKKLFANFQRGKELEEYVFLDGHYLVAGDGTGSFSSKNVSCINCCVKHHRDGTGHSDENLLSFFRK